MITKGHPAYCEKQARKTPMIPTHNGYPNCRACGADVSALWNSLRQSERKGR